MKEDRVQQHVCRRRRRPVGLKSGWWVKEMWWWNGLFLNMRALGLEPHLALINIILIIMIIRFTLRIVLGLLISS